MKIKEIVVGKYKETNYSHIKYQPPQNKRVVKSFLEGKGFVNNFTKNYWIVDTECYNGDLEIFNPITNETQAIYKDILFRACTLKGDAYARGYELKKGDKVRLLSDNYKITYLVTNRDETISLVDVKDETNKRHLYGGAKVLREWT